VSAVLITGVVASSAVQAGAQAGVKTLLGSSLAAKLAGATLLSAVAVGAGLAPTWMQPDRAPVHTRAERTREARPVRAREPSARTADALELNAAVEVAPASADEAPTLEEPSGVEALPVAPTSSVGILAAELALLDRASEALSRREPAVARVLLAQHRTRFGKPALAEERDALDLIARCQLDDDSVQVDVKTFLSRASQSVLGARVANSCPRSR
jgi:hypothetical protein